MSLDFEWAIEASRGYINMAQDSFSFNKEDQILSNQIAIMKALLEMADAIERQAEVLSLRREERSFAAHVTIGRVRSPKNRRVLADTLRSLVWRPPRSFRASTITLYQSVLGSAGPRYSVLAEFPLGAR